MAVLRDSAGSVDSRQLDGAWPEPVQRERALQSLLTDGLAVRTTDGRYGLPD